jgi:hypothetical protein
VTFSAGTVLALLGYIGGKAFEGGSWKSYAMAFGIAGVIAVAGIVYWRVSERSEAR